MKLKKPLAINETGRRQNQEDFVYPLVGEATDETRTFIVCDGMGGHEAGEVASSTVATSIAGYISQHHTQPFSTDLLKAALNQAYDDLSQRDHSQSQKRMGTTLTFLHLSDDGAMCAHIGDSRIYQIRRSDGGAKIVYKSSDHSLVNELVRAGVISAEEAVDHPKKNVITRAMQSGAARRDGPTVYTTNDVADGDWFFMCTDGVSEVVDDAMICELWGNASLTDEMRADIIKGACAERSHDNYSAYIIPIEKGVVADAIISDTEELMLTSASVAPAPGVADRMAPMTPPPGDPVRMCCEGRPAHYAPSQAVAGDRVESTRMKRLLPYILGIILAIAVGIGIFFSTGMMSKIGESETDHDTVYDATWPDADEDGYSKPTKPQQSGGKQGVRATDRSGRSGARSSSASDQDQSDVRSGLPAESDFEMDGGKPAEGSRQGIMESEPLNSNPSGKSDKLNEQNATPSKQSDGSIVGLPKLQRSNPAPTTRRGVPRRNDQKSTEKKDDVLVHSI